MHALSPCPGGACRASAGQSMYHSNTASPEKTARAPWLEDLGSSPQDKPQPSQLADMSAGCSCGQKHLSFPNVREWLNSADNVRVYSFTINHLGSLILIVCDMLTAPSHSGDRGAHSVCKNIKGILQGASNDW